MKVSEIVTQLRNSLNIRRGFAIMLVLMMLFLLFMLGVAFLFSAWTHAFMARNYLNMKRAFVVAEGGVHHAIGRIIGDFSWSSHAQNKPVDFHWKYWGDVEPGTPEPNLLDRSKTPVEYAQYPSYAMGKTLTVFGEEVGLSGVMDPGGGAYGINSDIFHLKVNECSAQLYVNEGLGHPYNTAVMRRILNTLGTVIIDPDSGGPLVPDDPSNPDDGLGDRIMNNRPPEGYKTKLELREKLGKDFYDKVKDFLCVHTWSDPKVVNPVPLSWEARDAYDPELFQTRPGYPENTITRYGRGKRNLPPDEALNGIYTLRNERNIQLPPNNVPMMFYEGQTGEAIAETLVYGWQELNPCWIETTSRAPVNINTAPREILVALLAGLRGFFVLEQLRKDYCHDLEIAAGEVFRFGYPPGGIMQSTVSGPFNVPGEIGVLIKTQPVVIDKDAQQNNAYALADAIIAHRPFRTWQDFNDLIDSLVWLPDIDSPLLVDTRPIDQLQFFQPPLGSVLAPWGMYRYYGSQAIADVIKANFNPDLHLNELNPNAPLYTMVDKTDLIKNSTEFCFLPTGYFEIESVGQILRAEWEPGRFHISPYLLIMKNSFRHNNQIMGQRRLRVEVKLWDLYRQTTQRDFIAGTYSRNNSQYHTNLNLGCESGPEVNNGFAPFENGYEGYIQLSTYGGSMGFDQQWVKGKLYRTKDFQKEQIWAEEGGDGEIECPNCKGTARCTNCQGTGLQPCPWGSPCYTGLVCPYMENCCVCNKSGSVPCTVCSGSGACGSCKGTGKVKFRALIHAHYDFDFTLHRDNAGHTRPLTEAPVPAEAGGKVWGVADKTEGLYKELYRSPYAPAYNPGRYRLCRSYRYGKQDRSTLVAPYDQRIDGFYAERFAMLPYYSWGGNFNVERGSISYWIKPGFYPELHSYPRIFCSITKGPGSDALFGCAQFVHMWGWGDWLQPLGMSFRIDQVFPPLEWFVPYPYIYKAPKLNYRFHEYTAPEYRHPANGVYPVIPSNHLFRHHRWIHVDLIWLSISRYHVSRILVNGRELAPYSIIEDTSYLPPDYTVRLKDGSFNPFIVGGARWEMITANSTIDEFVMIDACTTEEVVELEDCPTCGGDGKVTCPGCGGKGVIKDGTGISCEVCGGDGIIEEECKCPKDRKCKGGNCLRWCRCGGLRHSSACNDLCTCQPRSCMCPVTRVCKGGSEPCYFWCRCRGTGIRTQRCWCTGLKCRGGEGSPCYPWCKCEGTGEIGYTCQACGGDGEVGICPRCEGEGRITCDTCGGSGKVPVTKEKIAPVEEIRQMWWRGRYYRQNDAVFTSKEIDLARIVERAAPNPNPVKDPYEQDRWTGDEGLTEQQAREWLTQTWYNPGIKILGVTWTAYTKEVMDHHGTEYGEPAKWLDAQVELSLERKEGNNWLHIAGPFLNADAGWAPVFAKVPEGKIRYRVRFNTRCDPANAILLETPVLDDVTIYWMTQPQFFSWVEGY